MSVHLLNFAWIVSEQRHRNVKFEINFDLMMFDVFKCVALWKADSGWREFVDAPSPDVARETLGRLMKSIPQVLASLAPSDMLSNNVFLDNRHTFFVVGEARNEGLSKDDIVGREATEAVTSSVSSETHT